MSQENVEQLHRLNDAFNGGDKPTWLALLDPDVVMVPARDWPENAPLRGADAVWDFYTEVVTGAWEAGSNSFGEVVDAGGDTVVVNFRREAHGKASGAPFEFSYWCVTTFREGGQVRRFEWFVDRAAALEAAGLSE